MIVTRCQRRLRRVEKSRNCGDVVLGQPGGAHTETKRLEHEITTVGAELCAAARHRSIGHDGNSPAATGRQLDQRALLLRIDAADGE